MAKMNHNIISQLRLRNQKILNPDLKTARQVAGMMGALQAQDYIMAKWALGLRMQDSTEEQITREIDSGDIIRTHVLRPTWHIVSSDDIYWIIEFTAPQIKASMSYRDRQLEITGDILNKAYDIFIRVLEGNNHKTREELITELKKDGIRIDENRASHIFMRAETEALICSGKQVKNKPAFALLEERVPARNRMSSREEALQELGERYFITRGPATARDFSWWSGLSLRESKLALELNKRILVSRTFDGQDYWFAETNFKEQKTIGSFLLPSYDEFLISYRDRSAAMQIHENGRVVSNNGIFYPIILLNGKVAGTWKRNLKNNSAVLELDPFENETGLVKSLGKSISKYSDFIARKTDVQLKPGSNAKPGV
jgi:hypothetical protein